MPPDGEKFSFDKNPGGSLTWAGAATETEPKAKTQPPWQNLPEAVGNSRLAQIVWRHLQANSVSNGKSDEMLAHLATQMG